MTVKKTLPARAGHARPVDGLGARGAEAARRRVEMHDRHVQAEEDEDHGACAEVPRPERSIAHRRASYCRMKKSMPPQRAITPASIITAIASGRCRPTEVAYG